MEWYTADSYKDYEFTENDIFEKNGNKYASAKCKCDRCVNGVFVVGMENGALKPHPNYGGVCLKCGGVGFVYKEIRLYTKKEYDQMQKSKEKQAEKNQAEREAKMKAEFAQKKADWLQREGFDSDGMTWIYKEVDSYDRKEELKALGFRYNPNLVWHIANLPAGYEEHCFQINVTEVATFSAWGTGTYNIDAQKMIKEKIESYRPAAAPSEWIGVEGEKIEVPATCVSIREFEGAFGLSQVFTFNDEEGNVIVWFSASHPDISVGDSGILKAGVKAHTEYKGQKQTQITRAKFLL